MGEGSGLAAKVQLAQQVRKPMKFFTIALFLIVGALVSMYLGTSGPIPWEAGLVMAVLAASLSVLPICVLLWAKTRLDKDPNAFKDE